MIQKLWSSIVANGKKFCQEKYFSNRRYILLQILINLVILHQTNPILLQCGNLSTNRQSQNFQSVKATAATFEDICGFNIKPVFVSNASLMFIGCVLVFLLYSKGNLNKNDIVIDRVIDWSLVIYVWILISIYFLNPARLSVYHNNDPSPKMFYMIVKYLVGLTFYITSLPISLTQTISLFFGKSWCNSSSFSFDLYNINYNWSAIFVVTSFALQCLLLHRISDYEKLCTSKSEYVKTSKQTLQNIIKGTQKGKFRRNISLFNENSFNKVSYGNPGVVSSLSTILKQRESIGESQKSTPEILQKRVSLTTLQERPVVLGSPTRPKPVNVTKPLTINANTNPKPARTYPGADKITQTNIDVIYLSVNFKDKQTQTSVDEFCVQETESKEMSLLSLLSRRQECNEQNVSKSTQTENREESTVLLTTLQMENRLSQTAQHETNKNSVAVQFHPKPAQNLRSKSSQTELNLESKSSQKDKHCDMESFSVHEAESIDIMPKNVSLCDSFTQIEIVTFHQTVQVDNAPTSSFSYDKGIQCHLELDTIHKYVNVFSKMTQTEEFVQSVMKNNDTVMNRPKLSTASIDEKEVQTIINANHFTEKLNKKVNEADQKDNIEQVALSITKLTNQLSRDTDPVQFKASKAQNNVWYVSLRSDVFLSLSYDILKYENFLKDEINHQGLHSTSDLLKIMKMYTDNYNKLSTCFEDDNESDDESFMNGFRL